MLAMKGQPPEAELQGLPKAWRVVAVAQNEPVVPHAGQATLASGEVDFKALKAAVVGAKPTPHHDRERGAHDGLGEKGVGRVHGGGL